MVKTYVLLIVTAMLIVGLYISGISHKDVVIRASSKPPTGTCTLWDDTQPFPIHRCEDDDGIVCMKSDSGMLQCNFN
jgi:hypothetical protein